MWVSVGFLLCSELPSSKFSNYGERSEARENARDRSGGKGELSLSFPARRTRISFACCSRGLLATPPNVEFAPRLCSERFFSAFSSFSPLLKNQHFQIPIRLGIIDEELLCGCATSKPLFLFFNFLLIVLLHATHLKTPFFPFISTYHRYKTIMNKTLTMINLLK